MASVLPPALALLFLMGCAIAPVGHVSESDTVCGRVGTVEVRIRAGIAAPLALDCTQALHLVAAESLPPRQWTLVWTGGAAGLRVDEDFKPHITEGMTYPAQRLIVVRAPLGPLAHELGHAADLDTGRPNARDE